MKEDSTIEVHPTVPDSDSHNPQTPTDNEKTVDDDVQPGVQQAEAVTIVWTLSALIVAYALIWLVYFVQGILTGVSGALLPYVTSDFAAHSLIPTTSVLSQVIGGVTNLFVAKILDIFGRPYGFVLCVGLATLGLITAAASNGVEAYATSQVFYMVGIKGLGYCLSVFIADTSSLRHRGLVQALCNSPYIITAWLAGPISTAFLNGAGWRWAFGMESILLPCVALPLFGLFIFHYRRALKSGVVPTADKTRRSLWQSIVYHSDQFDLIGLLLLSAGFAFLLLPFNLYTMAAKGWQSPLVICFLVFGIILVTAFGLWERFSVRVSLIPWNLLRDRTALGSCLVALALFLSSTSWNAYLSSFLQVVNGASVTNASYIVQSGTVVQILANISAGRAISYTGRYKPVSLYLAWPLLLLGTGLLIHLRHPTHHVGPIVAANVLLNFGWGIIMLTVEIGILTAAASQQYFAISIALLNLFAYFGSAVGLTVSAAIWQGTFPRRLARYLPADTAADLMDIYASIETQLSYEWGSPTRLAIQHAYGDTWRFLLTAGLVAWAAAILALLAWRNVDVRGLRQNKGFVV